MATIKYKGMELEVFSSDKPVIFDPQKKCVVWDEPLCGMKQEAVVLAYIPYRATNSRVIGLYNLSQFTARKVSPPAVPISRKERKPREAIKWFMRS